MLGKIGSDTRGDVLRRKAEDSGIATTHMEHIPRVSTPAIVELLGAGDGTHRFVFQCPLCATQLPKAAVVSKRHAEGIVNEIDSYEAYFFDRATPSTVRLAEAARDAGLLIVFEPTTTPRTMHARRAAALSDIVKVSQQPRDAMNRWSPADGASTQFIVETLGSRGTRFRGRSARGWEPWRELPPAEPTCVRDTAGAGDWLTAGLITFLLPERKEITLDAFQAALQYGQRLSALSLAYDGPHGALRELGAAAIRGVPQRTPVAAPQRQGVSPATDRSNRSEDDLASSCALCLTASG